MEEGGFEIKPVSKCFTFVVFNYSLISISVLRAIVNLFSIHGSKRKTTRLNVCQKINLAVYLVDHTLKIAFAENDPDIVNKAKRQEKPHKRT